MPVGFNSPARNLFLLGSSGTQVVSNFFESISKASTTDGGFIPDEIRYIDSSKKYALAGSAQDSNTKEFGWFERQDYDLDTGNLTTDYSVRIESTDPANTSDTSLRAMELDSNENLIVVGKTINVPWIAKYSNAGVLDWQSTTNSADVEYTGITSDSSGNYYACGSTPTSGSAQAFVEKFDSNGNPGWGKSAFMLGRDVVLEKISANSGGHVVAVGYLEDDSADKGYIVKIDTTTGEVLWDRTLERNISGFGEGNPSTGSTDSITPAEVRCTACYIDSRDQIYVVGTIDGNSPNDNGVGEFLIKYTAEGNMVWQRERDTRDYVNSDGAPNTVPFDVKSDGETEQTVVLSVEDYGPFALFNSDIFLSKYSKNGDLVFRRRISKGGDNLGAACLDADPSFYYIMFRDQRVNIGAGEPDRYTFGKVSTSGNGFGAFQYDDGEDIIDYTVVSNAENKIGRLSDGSVTNSVSDLMTYPFTANKIVFDDLATHVSNKKRQMDSADSFEYSGSPAIRVADFQEVNLLGDVYSGSGDWLDQSYNGNDATTSFTTTAVEPFSGAGSVAFDGVGDYLSLANSSNFAFGTSDFTVEMWVYHTDLTGQQTYFGDTYGATAGIYTYKTSTNELSFYDDAQRLVSSTNVIQLNTWHHVAWTRTSGVLRQFLDGVKVGEVIQTNNYTTTEYFIGDTAGTSSGEMRGYISNARVIKGTSLYTSNFTPPASALTNTGQTTGTDYYTGSEWSPAGINAPEDAFTASNAGSGGNGGNFGPFTYTFATPVTGVTSARIRGSLGATSSQVGGTTNVIQVDGQDVTQKFKNAGAYAGQPNNPAWVDVTAEVGSTWNSFRVFGQSGSTNPNVSGVEVNGVQLLSSPGTNGTVLLTAQGASISDASDSNLSITVNGDAAASVGGTNTVAYNSAGGYFEFDGTNDYIQLPTNSDLTFTGDFSYETWLWTDVQPASNTIWSLPNGQTFQFTTLNSQSELIYYSVPAGNQSFGPLANNTWAHYVITKSGNTMTGYLNGAQAWTTTPGSSATHNFSGSSIGYRTISPANQFYWDGRMGEIRIYPRALTAAQAFQNYNATKSKYINEAPDTAPKIGPGVVYDSNLLLNYDFGNRATYDRAQNLIPNSEDFTKWNQAIHFWENNYAIAPDGTKTAALLKESIPSQQQLSYQSIGVGGASLVVGETYTYTVYAKANTRDTFEMHMYGDSSASFNLTTGSSTSSSSMTDVGDGWWLCKWVREKTNTAGVDHVYLGFSGLTYAGAGVDESIFIWRPQFERGDVSRGRYIKTSGVSITAPTTVKNLSSSSYSSTISGAEFNSAGYFVFDNANNDEIISSQTTVADTGMPGITLEIWANLSSSTTFGTDFTSWVFGEEGRYRMVYGTNYIQWVCATANNSWYSTGTTATTPPNLSILDGWHHMVGVYNGDKVRLVLDGTTQVESTSAISGNVGTSGNPQMSLMGTDASNVGWGTGSIGQVRIYNTGLTNTQILQNYNATRAKYGV